MPPAGSWRIRTRQHSLYSDLYARESFPGRSCILFVILNFSNHKRFKVRLLVVLLLSLACTKSYGQNEHLVEVHSSRFLIQGETNVNRFECALFQDVSDQALKVQSVWGNYNLRFDGLQFRYPVEKFDCNLDAMNEDMQELLKSDEYPYLYLEIHDIHIDRSNTEIERLKVAARITINLAGVSRQFVITDGVVINRSEEELTFLGKKTLKMTDFNIEPPTKFFGMVTVTDELKVEFEINMQVDTLK